MKSLSLENKILRVIGNKGDKKELQLFIKQLNSIETPKIEFSNLGLPDARMNACYLNTGLLLMYNINNVLTSVRVYLSDDKPYKKYTGKYNDIIHAGTTKRMLVKKFGVPSRENNQEKLSFGLFIPKWISYDYKDVTVNYTFYGKDDLLSMITIMTPDDSPGRKNAA